MKSGDFTELARHYENRPGYSEVALDLLLARIARAGPPPAVADVGAGTGKLTRQLAAREIEVTAVEPSDAMRAEGVRVTEGLPIEWRAGSGEETGLPDGTFRWALMASSFHWTDPRRSLPEFARILEPGGFFTALWNPRDLERSEFHTGIEEVVRSLGPDVERMSSGHAQHLRDVEDLLVSTGQFRDPVLVEARHEEVMSRERYLGAWRSTNDIHSQVSDEIWDEILRAIERETEGHAEIAVPYKTRAWTVQKV